MSKIPVGETIGFAYRFAFGGFLKIASVVWLPWLVVSASNLLLRDRLLALSAATAVHDPSAIFGALAFIGPFYLVGVFLLFMQIAGVTEEALGTRRGSSYYYFNAGKPVWRLIGAFLLLLVVLIASYFLLILGMILFGAIAAILAKVMNLSGLAAAIFGLIAIGFLIAVIWVYFYCLLRASFLLAPSVIAEHRASIKRGWDLAKGNVWRIFLVFLAVMIPIMAVITPLMFYFLFQGLPPMLPPQATAGDIAANRLAVAAWNMAAMNRMTLYWYLVYPAYGVFTVLFYGLGCGAQCFAYRALTQNAGGLSASHP